MDQPIFVNYGGGTNSTALLVLLKEKGLKPTQVIFSDTGGEHPHTYKYLGVVDEWLRGMGWPGITRVRWIRKLGPDKGRFLSLERVSLTRRELPSIAYGFKGCSSKWKAQPVERAVKGWIKDNEPEGKVLRYLGIDAGESHRAKYPKHPLWSFHYPLIDADWYREDCTQAIKREGLPQPGKSSCFFCPSMRRQEIVALGYRNPSLLQRAIAIEKNAASKEGSTIVGLGRSFRWADVWAAEQGDEEARARLPKTWRYAEDPCGCYDG